MRSHRPVLAFVLSSLCSLFAISLAAQDVVTVGTVSASGTTVDVPVYVRDVAGTPLGMDQPAGSHIQAFSIKVVYAPASAVQSVTFTKAGITAGLNPTFETSPSNAGEISLLENFQESSNPIPFTLNAPAPGNQVAHLVFTLSAAAAPGTTISLTLEPSLTQLNNDGGTNSETQAKSTLSLVNGSITVAVAPPPAQCDTPNAPQPAAPATSEAGRTYSISWPAVAGASDYIVDESTDANFVASVSSTGVTTPAASFTHSTGARYYYRVRARNLSNGCGTSSGFSPTISVLVTVTLLPQTRVLPVVGSTPAGFGAYFKTSVQMHNPKSTTISGKIVFHPQAVSGSQSDPTLAFTIAPGKTLAYGDLLPAMGVATGIGSADVIIDAGSAIPIVLARVFSDGGTAGTTGLATEPMSTTDALQQGQSGSLLAPVDAQRFRLNVGVRTLEQGASITFTVRNNDGNVVKTATKSYDATYFVQRSSTDVLDGYALVGGESIAVDVTSGSAFVYGSTTDNTTNDPSVQFAHRND